MALRSQAIRSSMLIRARNCFCSCLHCPRPASLHSRPTSVTEGSSGRQSSEQYGVVAVVRVTSLPLPGQLTALLRLSQPIDVASRYQLCASLFLDDGGRIITRSALPDEDTAPSSTAALAPTAQPDKCVRPGVWHVIILNADCVSGQVMIYLDGVPSATSAPELPELLVLGSRITILGGGRAAEHRGGHLRLVAVIRGALLTDAQIQRYTILRDPSFTLPRTLCLAEPSPVDQAVSSLDSTAAVSNRHEAWPFWKKQQCLWLESVRTAAATPTTTAESIKTEGADDVVSLDLGRIIRLGSRRSGPAADTQLAFWAMPTAASAHAARHHLPQLEQKRVQDVHESAAVAALTQARDDKLAKAAGHPPQKPSAAAAATASITQLSRSTPPIAIAAPPRLARLQDLHACWPLAHGLCPPPATAAAATTAQRAPQVSAASRFLVVSNVPNTATAADVATACNVSCGHSVVSCDRITASASTRGGAAAEEDEDETTATQATPGIAMPDAVVSQDSQSCEVSWCVGVCSSGTAHRLVQDASTGKLRVTVHGQDVTLAACPNQDTPGGFVLKDGQTLGGSQQGSQGGHAEGGQQQQQQPCQYCGELCDPPPERCQNCGWNGLCQECDSEMVDDEEYCENCGWCVADFEHNDY
eukprot:COSAG01_NODE_3978_length_5471_cov_3.755862_4_plen_644_part_00